MSNEKVLNQNAGPKARPASPVNLRAIMEKKDGKNAETAVDNRAIQADNLPETEPAVDDDNQARPDTDSSSGDGSGGKSTWSVFIAKNKKMLIIALIAAVLVIILIFAFTGKDGDKADGLSRTCVKLSEKITAEIDNMNFCQAASNCVILNGCPYGCNNLINNNADMKKFSELNAEYRAECGVCESSCAHSLRPSEIACAGGKCVSSR